jgi:S1-C subfamily serine protease
MRIWLILALSIGLLMPPPAKAGAVADAMVSVVAVLPDWGGGYRRQPGQPEEPEGSAVAVMPGGYFATNAHVLGPATKVDVRLPDGQLRTAIILGRDTRTDIALLKAPVDAPVPTIAAAPPAGAQVCAIGNAFGLGISVSCGVVSATRRTNTGFNVIEDFIQTDAAVNPGASGGALVDGHGRLVGLLSAIFTKQSDANIGVNFATSSALLMRVVSDLRNLGRVRFGKTGWMLRPLSAEDRRKASGARVARLDPAGAAAGAGVKTGDLVRQVDGRDVHRPADAAAALYMHRPGETATVTLERDGKPLEIRIVLSE